MKKKLKIIKWEKDWGFREIIQVCLRFGVNFEDAFIGFLNGLSAVFVGIVEMVAEVSYSLYVILIKIPWHVITRIVIWPFRKKEFKEQVIAKIEKLDVNDKYIKSYKEKE